MTMGNSSWSIFDVGRDTRTVCLRKEYQCDYSFDPEPPNEVSTKHRLGRDWSRISGRTIGTSGSVEDSFC